MTKADIVNEISKSTGIDKASVLETVEKFMEIVKDSLANEEDVFLRGFGSYADRCEPLAGNHLWKADGYLPGRQSGKWTGTLAQ